MNFRRAFISALAALGLSACAPVDAPAQQGPVEITLARGVCYGFCPITR